MARKKAAASLKAIHYKEYRAWLNALHRCHNPNNLAYRKYGAKNIFVCDRWRHPTKGFEYFLEDMGERPSGEYSLEREDNLDGYSKQNCVWADKQTQQNNLGEFEGKGLIDLGLGVDRYGSPYMDYMGRVQTLAEWATERGIKSATIRQRLLRALSVAEALDKSTSRAGEINKPMLHTLLLPASPTSNA